MKKSLFVSFFIFLCFTACKKDKKEQPTPSKGFDRQAMLQNIGENNIVPSFKKFSIATEALVTACDDFTHEPSDAKLQIAEKRWLEASSAWKLCELYYFGPMEDRLLKGGIDLWPVPGENVEEVIASTAVINDAYIESKGGYFKGLKAIEYLLFNNSEAYTYIINQYTTDTLAERRKECLNALAINLNKKAGLLYDAWQPASGNYLQAFVTASGTDISSSISKMVNQMVYFTDFIRNQKLGVPLGKMNGDVRQPDKVESLQSKTSLDNIRDNLTSLETLFLGRSLQGENGLGFDDFLDFNNTRYGDHLLSQEIIMRLKNAKEKVTQVNMPLQEAVLNDPSAVEAAYLAMKDLLVVLKTDMVSSLGIGLTFTDNDGD